MVENLPNESLLDPFELLDDSIYFVEQLGTPSGLSEKWGNRGADDCVIFLLINKLRPPRQSKLNPLLKPQLNRTRPKTLPQTPPKPLHHQKRSPLKPNDPYLSIHLNPEAPVNLLHIIRRNNRPIQQLDHQYSPLSGNVLLSCPGFFHLEAVPLTQFLNNCVPSLRF